MPQGQRVPGHVPPQLGQCFPSSPSMFSAQPGNAQVLACPSGFGQGCQCRGGGLVGKVEAFASSFLLLWRLGLCFILTSKSARNKPNRGLQR